MVLFKGFNFRNCIEYLVVCEHVQGSDSVGCVVVVYLFCILRSLTGECVSGFVCNKSLFFFVTYLVEVGGVK